MKVFSSGGIELHVLDDGTWRFPAAAFFDNVREEAWRRELRTDAEGKIPVGHNYGLIAAAGELVVVDTGYGDETHGGCTGHLLEALERAGRRREEVTKVVSSHAHGDHIKRNTLRLEDGSRVPTFPNARYFAAREDWEWFSGPGHVPEFDEQVRTIERLGKLSLVESRPCELLPGVRLLATPGHTPGHTSVLIEAGGQSALLLGDVCHHVLHFSHPEWVSRFDTHPAITPRTREQIFALALERDALVLCPHLPFPGTGKLVRSAEGIVWEPQVRELQD